MYFSCVKLNSMSKHFLLSIFLSAITYATHGQSLSKIDAISEVEPACFTEIIYAQVAVVELTNTDSQQCFDHSMEQWFQLFLFLQDEGYDMNQAHQMAYQEVLELNQMCNTSTSKIIDKSLLSLQ